MGTLPVALQLYTVRDHMEKDFAGTLERVKAIGYDFVEAAGFGPYTPPQLKELLDKAGLTPVSSHFGAQDLCENPGQVAEALRALGIEYAVVSAHFEEDSGWRTLAKSLDAAGASLREEGFTLCYHNHAHEFRTIDGQYVLDYLYANTKPEHVAAQLDTYWVQEGGENPADYISRYSGRCPLAHLKDMTPGEPHTFAEVGRGILDWDAVFDAGNRAGVKWYIVEQDICQGDSLESARISKTFLDRR